MKTLYLDCSMGAAGDMLSAALLMLHPAPETVLDRIRGMALPGVTVALQPMTNLGVAGMHYQVDVDGAEESEGNAHHGQHHGRHLGDVEKIIRESGLPDAVIEDAVGVYRLLAEAESAVHGVTMEQIHFHEVGTLDAIVDISTVCLLMHELGVEQILASPVHVGSGTVRCAHGVLPVPAPATARLLTGVPIYGGEIEGELCTPTGAALLKYFAKGFAPLPPMRVEHIGCGIGRRQFPRANCLRAFLGQTGEQAVELRCNVDDMSGEAIGHALQALMDAGALDAWWQPIGMKKSRPGMLLSLLCRPEDRERMLELLFRHTGTIGVRETLCSRTVLRRHGETLETPFGPVRLKVSEGCGVRRVKAEYEDLAALAKETGLTLPELKAMLRLDEEDKD